MECKDLRELVVQYSSGDLPDGDKDFVETHLRECGECSALLRRSDALWSLLDEWKDVEPRTEFVSEFWSRVSKEESRKSRGFFGIFKNKKPAWTLAGALASFLLVGVFTFAILGPGEDLNTLFSRDERDEKILIELDNATTRDTTAALEIYGPWDSGMDIVNINGSGGFNN